MKRIGILGGGQLGRMLLQQAANYPVETWVMESDPGCPAAGLCHHFVKGDIRNADDVVAFGRQVDVLTIEIENVSLEGLQALESEGRSVFPNSHALGIIRDKSVQKVFYAEHGIPTAPFRIIEDRSDLHRNLDFLPAVQKLATGGYDGRGVQILRTEDDLPKAFDARCVLEKLIPVHKEVAVMVAIDAQGGQTVYPAVEMVFDPLLNLLDMQVCPADLTESEGWKVEAVALSVARNLRSPGLFAVELLLDAAGNVYVNETAPRVHNSGHHSIEGNFCSQFDMLLRLLADYPAGNTDTILPSLMLNLLGEEGYAGTPVYEGLGEVLAMENAFVHVYGKRETRPGRKMGHVTLLGGNRHDLMHRAGIVRRTLKVKGTERI
ncbi:MAG: 5-(carboxyamino)imidazole ribonucleotide synthase [Chitinophagia bacterium]|nr:5-(carboxyamino)imidazole ribonucleotide synthase [Chitinophagia bacterium]